MESLPGDGATLALELLHPALARLCADVHPLLPGSTVVARLGYRHLLLGTSVVVLNQKRCDEYYASYP